MDGLVQCPIEGATHGANTVNALDGFPRSFGRGKPHRHMDPPDHQHSFFRLHLAGYVCGKPPVAGVDLARLQRTPKVPTIQPAVAEMT